MSDEKLSFLMVNPQQGHQCLMEAWKWAKVQLLGGARVSGTLRPENRSAAQNRMMWSVLTDLAAQVPWNVDGQTRNMSPEDWKHVLTAGLTKHVRMARGIDGGVVILGQSTSKMTVKQMTELIELAYAFGAGHGVQWSRTSLGQDVPDEVAGGAQ